MILSPPDPDGCRYQEENKVAGDSKKASGKHHQDSADDEHSPPADAVRVRRNPQRDDRISDEGQGQEEADLRFRKAGLRKIEDQNHREKSVGKKADDPCREEEPPVSA